jgi:hypothetical protein
MPPLASHADLSHHPPVPSLSTLLLRVVPSSLASSSLSPDDSDSLLRATLSLSPAEARRLDEACARLVFCGTVDSSVWGELSPLLADRKEDFATLFLSNGRWSESMGKVIERGETEEGRREEKQERPRRQSPTTPPLSSLSSSAALAWSAARIAFDAKNEASYRDNLLDLSLLLPFVRWGDPASTPVCAWAAVCTDGMDEATRRALAHGSRNVPCMKSRNDLFFLSTREGRDAIRAVLSVKERRRREVRRASSAFRAADARAEEDKERSFSLRRRVEMWWKRSTSIPRGKSYRPMEKGGWEDLSV